MDPRLQQDPDALYQEYDKALYRITGDEMSNSIFDALMPDPTANNSSMVSVPADSMGSGIDTSTTSGAAGSSYQGGKQTFDNTQPGYILGIDKDGLAKFFIGNTTKYINWDGSNLTVVGGVSVSSLNIPDQTTADSFHVDSLGNLWIGANVASGLAAAPFSVTKAGVVVATQVTVTGTINATGGYVGTTTALVYEAQGISVGITGYIRGGQTDYNTGTGFFLGYSSGAYKFSVGNPAANYITWDGSTLTVNGYVVSSKGAFGGDGSDGALTISSGTTTTSLGSAQTFIKNYSSISITGTGKQAYSNPATNGTIITLKSQGAVTLTSSSAPMLDASSLGAAGGAHGGAGGSDGTIGSAGYGNVGVCNAGDPGDGAGGTPPAQDRAGGVSTVHILDGIAGKVVQLLPGGGGGGGGAGSGGQDAGDGGRGGGCFYIECAGALNFTTASGISVAGAAGGGANTGGGGGGGGGGGVCVILYNTLTSSAGTITKTGGSAGAKGADAAVTGGDGGGGGAGGGTSGSTGVAHTGVTPGDGGAGGTGASLLLANNSFA